MTGPDHYKHAETLLDMAADEDFGTDLEKFYLAKAQVHATLAVAAATALNDAGGDGMGAKDWDAWREVASLSKPGPRTPPEGTS